MGASIHRGFDVALESEGEAVEGLRVFGFVGREAISELYELDVDVACMGDPEVTSRLAPGELFTVVFRDEGEVVRRIPGMISAVRQRLDQGHGRLSWRVRLVPRAARLRLVATQSIFLGQTVPAIISGKLDAVGLGPEDVVMQLIGSYPALDFVVQFAETDLAFVSRRAEHAGISYFFSVAGDVERMTFVDDGAAFPVLAGAPHLSLVEQENVPHRVRSLEREDVMVPGVYCVQDYNYRRPNLQVFAEARLEGGAGGVVEHGVHVKSPEEAAALAAVRAEELLCRRSVYRGESTVPFLSAGHRTTVDEHGELPAVELLITSVEHHASLPLTAEGTARPEYHNRFEAVPLEHTFRPRRVTAKPTMPGLVTAVIQSPDGRTGGTAVLDADGRYTVQLHLETVLGEKMRSSHPVRMTQPYGGTGHGMHFPLRPGTEVVLGFTNGDPDRPILLGAVPNALTLSPVTGSDPKRNRLVTKTGAILEIGEKE